MVTRDRRQFVAQSIWYFLRQDYEPRELLILDDGRDAVADLVPQDPRFRYVRLAERRTLGEARNAGCEIAAGELVAHWDDDDWHAPQRLSAQVQELTGRGADACVIADVLHYRLHEGQAWRQPACAARDSFGGTLLYRLQAWRGRPFPAVARDEHLPLLHGLPPDRVATCDDAGCYVALAHPGTASPRSFAGSGWERRHIQELGGLLAGDGGFYVGLRAGRTPGTAPQAPSRVRVVAPIMVYDGYGSMGEYLALGMARAGADVDVTPLRLDEAATTDDFRRILGRSRPARDEPTVCLAWWGDNLDRFASSQLFVNTMWESSRIPADWPARLSRAAAVIVPTTWVAEVFRSCGVTAPVEVVAQGVDPAVYHQEERPEREGLTTLMVGVLVPRKNVLEGVEAWRRAFDGDAAARLVIKSRSGGSTYVPTDDRIRFVASSEPTRGIAHWYRQADVLMALGNEGFGLPLVEGMATGLPVVALDAEGQADVCREAGDLVLSVGPARWEPVVDPRLGDCGVRAIPDVDEVAGRLRWVAEHREEARDVGRAASRWALRHRDVWAMGPSVLTVMEAHVRPRRPLRRCPTLCSPGEGPAADYGRHLADELGHGVNLVDAPLDLRGVRLLHVQHTPEGWDDLALARIVREAGHSGIPVLVTEHRVEAGARSWEQVASVLVTHGADAADRLRRRWPTARVEVVPVGCPSWTEPRARASGRTLAVIGWPRAQHGWWAVLDLLRERDGLSLLALHRGGPPSAWEAWRRAAAGLPVEVIDVASARTAAESAADRGDLVVLWHDQEPGLGPSYEARVAVASGLPVLTSRAAQFADLEDAAFRPASLAEGVVQALDDGDLRGRLVAAAQRFCRANSWALAAERHRALWSSLGCA
jgi:glycosyltransferase involved in cell wall biosynthesis